MVPDTEQVKVSGGLSAGDTRKKMGSGRITGIVGSVLLAGLVVAGAGFVIDLEASQELLRDGS